MSTIEVEKNGKTELYREYYDNGKLKYNICYKWGIKYDKSGEPIYEGGFNNLKYDGVGTLFFNDAEIIKLLVSLNIEYNNEKLIYNGDFKQGIMNGIGRLYIDEKILYSGNFKNNKFNGNGKIYNSNGLIYEGEFENNNPMNGMFLQD